MATPSRVDPELLDLGRLVALVDGVFAFSLTLLIIDLRPPVPGGDLLHELRQLVPRLLIYLFAFVTIANQWLFHHHLFRLVRRTNSRLLVLSFLYLLFLTLIPVSAAIVGGWPASPLAAACFSANTLLLCLSACAVWTYLAANRSLLAAEADPGSLRRAARAWLYVASGMALALGAGFLHVYAAYLMWVLWPITARWVWVR
jgi:uncharacterized membrane protein